MEITHGKIEQEKRQKNLEKENLEKENQKLGFQLENILMWKQHDEKLIELLLNKEQLLQSNFKDILSFMNICDTTISQDLSRSRTFLMKEKLNPQIKQLLERDSAKIEKAKQTVKESLLSMKKNYEKIDDVGLI